MNQRKFDVELAALDEAIRDARNRVAFDPASFAYRSELESLQARRRRVIEERARAFAPPSVDRPEAPR